YAFRFRYLGAWEGNVTQADITSATAAIEHQFAQTIGLPVAQSVRYERGPAWTLRLPENQALGAFNIGTLAGAESQLFISSGEWPPETATDSPVPVIVSETMLFRMGVQVGDTLTAAIPGQ